MSAADLSLILLPAARRLLPVTHPIHAASDQYSRTGKRRRSGRLVDSWCRSAVCCLPETSLSKAMPDSRQHPDSVWILRHRRNIDRSLVASMVASRLERCMPLRPAESMVQVPSTFCLTASAVTLLADHCRTIDIATAPAAQTGFLLLKQVAALGGTVRTILKWQRNQPGRRLVRLSQIMSGCAVHACGR